MRQSPLSLSEETQKRGQKSCLSGQPKAPQNAWSHGTDRKVGARKGGSPLPERGRVWEAMVRGRSMNGAKRSHAGPEKGVWTVVVGRAKVLSLGTNLPSRCREDRAVGYVFRHRQMPEVQKGR